MTDNFDRAGSAHDLRQPLNVISLAVANLRARLGPRLNADDGAYLDAKLSRIEEQLARATQLLQRKP